MNDEKKEKQQHGKAAESFQQKTSETTMITQAMPVQVATFIASAHPNYQTQQDVVFNA
jgi:hypothetical protein